MAEPAKHPFFEAVAKHPQKLFEHTPHAVALGIRVQHVEIGRIWVSVAYREDLVGNPETGIISGGVITAVLDNVCGSALQLTLDELVSIATLDLRIDYMRPATPPRDILAHAHCFKRTKSIGFVRAVAYHDQPEDPIASAVGTFMIGANRAAPAMLAKGDA